MHRCFTAPDEVRTNLDLLRTGGQQTQTRASFGNRIPMSKPVCATGLSAEADLDDLADRALSNVGAASSIAAADEVWTITSTLGFEALMRGRSRDLPWDAVLCRTRTDD